MSDHGLAVDQKERRLQAERSTTMPLKRPILAVAREAADTGAVPAHHQPVALVLDFVNPQRAGRRSGHLRRQARFDEAGGMAHDHGGKDRVAAGRFNRAQRLPGHSFDLSP